MKDAPLNGITIVDFTHRLPGPLCSKILGDLGAQVIKIEDEFFPDPFLAGTLACRDDSFVHWYKNLNQNKTIVRLNFNSLEAATKIKELVLKADALILGLSKNMQEKLELTQKDLTFHHKSLVVMELMASKNTQTPMHDLNALAVSGLLSLYVADKAETIINPPFLPIAGITFGQKAATDLLAGLIAAQKKESTHFVKIYMDQVISEILGMFWSHQDRVKNKVTFLHNGLYPCYAIYKAKNDHYLAVAAVEEKFWKKFCELLSLSPYLDRFRTADSSVFDSIAQKIAILEVSELDALFKDAPICVSLFASAKKKP